jgi:DNA polymerase-1
MSLFQEEQVNGNEAPNDKILLVDADTIIYATASVHEEEQLHPNWPNENYEEPFYTLDLEAAEEVVISKLNYMKERTGCSEIALYFTGRSNFRYEIFPEYKKGRKKVRHPSGLHELKDLFVEKYGNAFMCTGWEADDEVVYLKEKDPDKYMLAAIDKDVLNATPGRHYNYNKDSFIETSRITASYWPFYQCIIGDSGDGIKGVPGLGPKKAEKFIDKSMSDDELWEGVVEAYKFKDLGEEEAILTMQLVNMHQFDGKTVNLWRPSV